jgi:hypothetical protein
LSDVFILTPTLLEGPLNGPALFLKPHFRPARSLFVLYQKAPFRSSSGAASANDKAL